MDVTVTVGMLILDIAVARDSEVGHASVNLHVAATIAVSREE